MLANDYWRPNPAVPNPSNTLQRPSRDYKERVSRARNINTVTQALDPLQAFGIEGGRDFEKVESARLLQSSEYS